MCGSHIVFSLLLLSCYGQEETLQGQEILNNFTTDRQNSVEFEKIASKCLIGNNNEDASLNIKELLLKYNQPVESHIVKTEDGYILKVFRIPSKGTPVFLMHGLFSSADDFVTAGSESGLAYLLARAGYDVWMGNARGNKHSRKHDHLSLLNPKFWDFSWHEIGIYDLPAMIDYVLKRTGQKKLKYVGHSQGTTSFFVLASEKPEYNDKIAKMISLSPVAFMSNMKSPIMKLTASWSSLIPNIINQIGPYEFNPDNQFTRYARRILCHGYGTLSEIVCSNVVFLFVGFDFEQLNVTNLPVVFGHFPSSASIKQMQHYAQGINSGRFAKYDYGISENIKLYGSRGPPEYDLSKIKTPVYLLYSDNDWLADPIDVEKLARKLGNVAQKYKILNTKFNHLDFLFAKDVKKLVYEKVITSLKD